MNDQRVYAYFPGCSLEASNTAYDVSTRSVAEVLGLEMIELEDWNCCGATAYMAIHEKRSLVLAARNLALAERLGRELITVCSGCYLVLYKASKRLEEDEGLRGEIRRALQAGGMDYRGPVRVRHFLDVVCRDLGEEAVRRHVVRPLAGLQVACYYGCQIGRPYGEIDDPELPLSMDRLMEWLGAVPIDYPVKAKCCGGMIMTTRPDLGRTLTGEVLHEAVGGGADCIATACPLCQMNLEAYQERVSRSLGKECRIPVLYFTQLMGTALGLGRDELALADSLTRVEPVLAGGKASR